MSGQKVQELLSHTKLVKSWRTYYAPIAVKMLKKMVQTTDMMVTAA